MQTYLYGKERPKGTKETEGENGAAWGCCVLLAGGRIQAKLWLAQVRFQNPVIRTKSSKIQQIDFPFHLANFSRHTIQLFDEIVAVDALQFFIKMHRAA